MGANILESSKERGESYRAWDIRAREGGLRKDHSPDNEKKGRSDPPLPRDEYGRGTRDICSQKEKKKSTREKKGPLPKGLNSRGVVKDNW